MQNNQANQKDPIDNKKDPKLKGDLEGQLKLPFTVKESKKIFQKHNSYIDDLPDPFLSYPPEKCIHLNEFSRKDRAGPWCLQFDLACKWVNCDYFKQTVKALKKEDEYPYLFVKKCAPIG